jgi:hypothetical protein
MGSQSIPLAPWVSAQPQAQQSGDNIPLAPWSSVPTGSAADPDPVSRFLNSFGSALTSPLSLPQQIMNKRSSEEETDLQNRLKSSDPKVVQSARDEIIAGIPGGSTYQKARKGDLAGAAGDIAGGVALGGLMGGAEPALNSDFVQASKAGLKAGAGDVAAGTAKAAAGTGVAVGAHSLGLGPFGEYMLAKPLIVKGIKQVGAGIKKGVEEGKTRYSLLKDPGDVEFPNPDAQAQGAFAKPGEEFELKGEQAPRVIPKQTSLDIDNPVDTSQVPTKSISYKQSQNPDIAKRLTVGAKRTMPDGSTQVLKSVPIDDISGDPGNQINRDIVNEYQKNGYSVHPELREGGETKYTINEGHHRILADVKNGKMNITTWVPAESK